MHDTESYQVYLTAKDLAERAHRVYIMKTCQCGDLKIQYHERELAKEYRELRSRLFERGMI